jgi:hypothetical protein
MSASSIVRSGKSMEKSEAVINGEVHANTDDRYMERFLGQWDQIILVTTRMQMTETRTKRERE